VSLWLRVGPLSVSSRGRIGVRAGPVSAYGGGRRRSNSSGRTGGIIFALLLTVGLIAVAVKLMIAYWFVTLPVVGIVIVLVLVAIASREDRAARSSRLAERARVARMSDTERRNAANSAAKSAIPAASRDDEDACAAWPTSAPATASGDVPTPPTEAAVEPVTIQFPRRFTDGWFASHFSSLNELQRLSLFEELRRRGWTDAEFESRVGRYS
jgi:hypothetical protein